MESFYFLFEKFYDDIPPFDIRLFENNLWCKSETELGGNAYSLKFNNVWG